MFPELADQLKEIAERVVNEFAATLLGLDRPLPQVRKALKFPGIADPGVDGIILSGGIGRLRPSPIACMCFLHPARERRRQLWRDVSRGAGSDRGGDRRKLR